MALVVSLSSLVQRRLAVLVPQVRIGSEAEKDSGDLRPAEAGGVVKRRRPLALVDVGALLTKILDHFLSPERRRPVQKRLADVVHVVDGRGAVLDGLDEGVGVLTPDAVDQLTVGLFSGAVDPAKTRQTTAGGSRCT